MSSINAKIDTLLSHNLKIPAIADTLERPIEEITLYVANRNMPQGISITLTQIQKMEKLFQHNVPIPEMCGVLEMDQRVIEVYGQNRRYLHTEETHSQASSPSNPVDFLRWVFGWGEHLKPYVEEKTYHGLLPEKWKEYQSSPLKLHWAIEQGYLHLFSENKDQIHTKNAQGYSPLQWAAIKGSSRAIKPLLDLGANKEETDKHGNTPIFLATQNDHEEVIAELKKYGANVNRKNNAKHTPLQVAVGQGKVNATRGLLQAGTNSNVVYQNKTSLLEVAIQKGNLTIIRLIAAHANGGARELTVAATKGLTTVQTLFEVAKAKYEPHTSEALWQLCCCKDAPDVAEYLIQQGANPCMTKEVIPKYHQPVLVQVVTRNFCSTARVLLQHGAQKQIDHKGMGYHPQDEEMLIYKAANLGFDEMVEILCENNARIKINLERRKTTLLHTVIFKCGEKGFRALVKRGVDVNQKNSKGISVLPLAIEYNLQLVPMLADLGFDRNEGRQFLAKMEQVRQGPREDKKLQEIINVLKQAFS